MKTLHVYPRNHKTLDKEANKKVLTQELIPLLNAAKLPLPMFLGESLDCAVARCERDFDPATKSLIAKLASSNNTTLDYSIVINRRP
jgi:hypothetical protein